jgi:DNA repair exonuclease SbcCD ATPase subunit
MDVELGPLISRIQAMQRELDQLTGQARHMASHGKEIQSEVVKLQAEIDRYDHVMTVLSTIGEQRQATAQAQIEALVTRGLHTVFGDELSFHIITSHRGKQASVEFIVRSTLTDGRVIDTDIMAARGGGLAAVVGFLLRLVVLLLSKPAWRDSVLVLDEPFAHLSKEYVPLMAEFLRDLTDKSGVQIILVSHQDEFLDVADKRYRFALGDDGTTQVEEI